MNVIGRNIRETPIITNEDRAQAAESSANCQACPPLEWPDTLRKIDRRCRTLRSGPQLWQVHKCALNTFQKPSKSEITTPNTGDQIEVIYFADRGCICRSTQTLTYLDPNYAH